MCSRGSAKTCWIALFDGNLLPSTLNLVMGSDATVYDMKEAIKKRKALDKVDASDLKVSWLVALDFAAH